MNSEDTPTSVNETEIDSIEAASFFHQQRANRSKRSCPASEAKQSSSKDLNASRCEICSFEAKTKTLLKGHMTGHPSCHICKMSFKTIGLLNRHLKDVHNVPRISQPPKVNTQHPE
jgi:hypothetical protein